MQRGNIKKCLENFCGPLVSRQQLANFMGYKDPHSVDKYLKGLNKIENKYFAADIADVLYEAQQ